MTTTYTPTLQLSLQGTGDNNNTWGTVANLVFAQVDQAVNGYLSLSVAGNSNVTLTWPTGTNVSNQANNPTIQFTGALTGNITVFVPAASRRMFYLNATTGTYTLTIAVVGTPGTTVAIPQGSCLPLWTDGTNVYSGLANLGPASFAGNVTIAGNVGIGTSTPSNILTVTAGNGDGIVLQAPATTYGPFLRIQNTGTGGHNWNIVSNGSLDGGGAGNLSIYDATGGGNVLITGNGDIGNVGIGTNAPGYKLQVAANNNATDGLYISNTSTGASAQAVLSVAAQGWSGVYLIQNQASGNVLLYSGDNVPMIFVNNAAERMRITAAGNVGIGASSPTTKLTVSGSGFNGGSGTFISTTNGNSVAVNGINAAGVNDSAYIYLSDGTNAGFFGLTAQNAPGTVGSLRFGLAGNEYARIQPNGNVGIGTTSPGYLLTVNGTGSFTGTLLANGGTALSSVTNPANNPITGTPSSSTYLRGDGTWVTLAASATTDTTNASNVTSGTLPNGRLSGSYTGITGVGTLTAGAIGTGFTAIPNSALANSSVTINGTGVSLGGSATVTAAAGTLTGSTLASGVTGSSLTSVGTLGSLNVSGNVGIGTTSPGSKLTVVANTNGNDGLSVSNTSTGASAQAWFNVIAQGWTGVQLIQNQASGTAQFYTADNVPMLFATNGTERMRITAAGNVGIGTSNPDSFYGNAVPLAVVKNQNAATILGVSNSSTGASAFTQISMVGGTANSFANIQLGDNAGSPYFQLTTGSAVSGISMIANSNGVKLAVNGTSWSSVSDERLKTAIEPISNAAAKVSGLRSVIGKFKTDPDGVRRPFLMAQDVQAVLPEAVNVAKDGMGTLELSYTDVIPLLVAAINELTTRIAALETKGA